MKIQHKLNHDDDVVEANNMQVFVCDKCGAFHFVLFDTEDDPLAIATLAPNDVGDLIRELQHGLFTLKPMRKLMQ